jgi:hypothetical protein
MKRYIISQPEGEESMPRTHRIVFGLIAVFVLGGSLVLLSCGSNDDTTDINGSNAAAQLGGKQFVFQAQTVFGVAGATLAFNGNATRFALTAGNNSVATGLAGYGDDTCTFTVGASTFAPGTGPQVGQVSTADPCHIDHDNNNNLTLNDVTSINNGPAVVTNFGG